MVPVQFSPLIQVLRSHLWLIIAPLIVYVFSDQLGGTIVAHLAKDSTAQVATLTAVLLILGSVSYGATSLNKIPSFVVAIVLGFAAKPILAPLVIDGPTMSTVVNLAAAGILFAGGLEITRETLKRVIVRVVILSFWGLFLTALLFSLSAYAGAAVFGIALAVRQAVLIGAVVASTDPASALPVLDSLRFKRPEDKAIGVMESALTDVVGAILTFKFAGMVAYGEGFDGVLQAYRSVLSMESLEQLGVEMGIGIVIGLVGFALITLCHTWCKRNGQTASKETECIEDEREHVAISAVLLACVLLVFGVALAWHGNPYLAAFVAGLLLEELTHLKRSQHFLDEIVLVAAKPAIFVSLGAMVDLQSLIEYWYIGLPLALVFMFVIRPIAVVASLLPWVMFRKMEWGQLRFLFVIRETGAIPAALLVMLAAKGDVAPLTFVLLMWSILMSLIVLPLATPWWARRCGVLEK